MRLLVIGGGGREHALVWKLSQSPRTEKIFAVPGNGGMAALAECRPDLPVISDLVDWAVGEKIDMVVIGPEVPLVAGLADDFERAGLVVFGPCKEAAQLEGSKSYAKEIMTAAGVPTAEAAVFSDFDAACDYLVDREAPFVIKADGLAAGKGVTIAHDIDAAKSALRECLVDERFGDAGSQVVVEEFLTGQEVSLLAFVDGDTIRPMPPAQDHKRIGDNDTGPNTGGMGAYSPVPFFSSADQQAAVENIMRPIINELAARGVTYKGILYAGLMITDSGPLVLEFNVRFGDPETQVLLPRLESDLVDIMEACAAGRLRDIEPRWSDDKCLTVVMASEGYPGTIQTGREISGLEEAATIAGVNIFHAGTENDEERILTAGGRVLDVTALGADFATARDRAYQAVSRISFLGVQYRTDIGCRVI
jgi:phosphoribosylamine--glycine ligase